MSLKVGFLPYTVDNQPSDRKNLQNDDDEKLKRTMIEYSQRFWINNDNWMVVLDGFLAVDLERFRRHDRSS